MEEIKSYLHESLGIISRPLFEATTFWKVLKTWEWRSSSNPVYMKVRDGYRKMNNDKLTGG